MIRQNMVMMMIDHDDDVLPPSTRHMQHAIPLRLGLRWCKQLEAEITIGTGLVNVTEET